MFVIHVNYVKTNFWFKTIKGIFAFVAAKSNIVVTCLQMEKEIIGRIFFSDCFQCWPPQRRLYRDDIVAYCSYKLYLYDWKYVKKAIWFTKINYIIYFCTNKRNFVVLCRCDFFHPQMKIFLIWRNLFRLLATLTPATSAI